MLGDFNNDEYINGADVVYIASIIAGISGFPNINTIPNSIGDINNDGKITGADVVYLASYVAELPGFGLNNFDVEKFNANRDLWKSLKIKNYSFVFRWQCFCLPEMKQPVTIIVENNKISKILDFNNNSIKNKYSYKTIDGLFDFIQNGINNNAFLISCTYNNDLGYITNGYIDGVKLIADDETGFVVSNFNIVTQLNKCIPQYLDNYDLNSMNLLNDILVLDIAYSGGCQKHEFELCWNGIKTDSIPPEISIVLSHNSNGDLCEAYIQEILHYDLSILKKVVISNSVIIHLQNKSVEFFILNNR